MIKSNATANLTTTATTTVQAALQSVIGLSPALARRALREFEVEIDAKRCLSADQLVTIQVGSTVRLGRTIVNVITAHLRTLDFYRDSELAR